MANRKELSRELSHALNVVRSLSAIYVVAHHVGQANNLLHGAGLLLKFGQEAVIVFFLLSGFLIYLNESNKTLDFSYFERRFVRLYPPLLMAMLVSVFVALYYGYFRENFSILGLFGTLLAMQDVETLKPGVIVEPFMKNEPLWSLSYEIVFYVIFYIIMKAAGGKFNKLIPYVGAGSCLAYVCFALQPSHWVLVCAYFQVWWTGTVMAHIYLNGEYRINKMKSTITWLAILSTTSLLIACNVGFSGFYQYPLLPFRHFAVAFFLVILSFSPPARLFLKYCQIFHGAFLYLASISYGLYILHWPILIQYGQSRGLLSFIVSISFLLACCHLFDRELDRTVKRWIKAQRAKHSKATPIAPTSTIF